MTAITEKLRDKMVKQNTGAENANELVKQNTYENMNKKKTIPANFGKRKTSDKSRTDKKNEKYWYETQKQTDRKKTMQSLRGTELDTITQVHGNRNKLQQIWEKRTLCKRLQTKFIQQSSSEMTNRRRNCC